MGVATVIALTLASVAAFLASLACFLLTRRRKMLSLVAKDHELGATSSRVADDPEISSVNVYIALSPPFPKSPRRFTWPEIESATSHFTSDVIGIGGFSTVHFALFNDSIPAAVKLHNISERLHRAFRLELDILGLIHHPFIVSLFGYCDQLDDQGVLVFEYMPNGNLHEKLHSEGKLSWAKRTYITYCIAKAIDYLHECCELQIIHGDIKASNVLLDGNLAPKLCDFGCARMGLSAVVQPRAAITGSPGYVDPHYIRTGVVSKKSDVYSFGVLVLELITGTECMIKSEPEKVIRAVRGDMRDFVDRRLAGKYDEREVTVMASILGLCIAEDPSLRPSMSDVVRIMEEKMPSAISAVGCKM